MELLNLARLLWARRWLVALGIPLAIAAGLFAARAVSGAAEGSAVASSQVVFDTSDSQLVNAAPRQVDTLTIRARLVADSMASDDARALVAREAGIRPSELAILGTWVGTDPPVESPLVGRAAAISDAPPVPYVLKLVADEEAPLIRIGATAPDAEQARRLSDAVLTGLSESVSSLDGGNAGGFVVDRAGNPQVTVVPAASRAVPAAVAATIMVFALWCGLVLVAGRASRLLRGSRNAAVPA